MFELLPEAAGQGFEELLNGVLTTGIANVAHELPSFIDRAGQRDTVYWNFVSAPLREPDGRVTGITVVATEVTEQVQGRQQIQQLNAELATMLGTAPESLSRTLNEFKHEGLIELPPNTIRVLEPEKLRRAHW
ncbi:helix-turn-helix domain-containing protein [Hymenobacter arizonensis]|uniref:helix-turn-helix domain-containing protein n=1 Tax=Hymenobacter arizonensis TaxID=1227077 RepID=UPI000B824EC1|nr:helix-turn-helix domain-containing protein [Hymenobacter arizonensis]